MLSNIKFSNDEFSVALARELLQRKEPLGLDTVAESNEFTGDGSDDLAAKGITGCAEMRDGGF